MKQTSSLTRRLTAAQEKGQAALDLRRGYPNAVLYSLYTEEKPNLLTLIRRYFPNGATLVSAIGVWQGGSELSKIIEIVGTIADLQHVFDLAGDIRVTNSQASVLVTWSRVSQFDITEDSINDASAAL